MSTATPYEKYFVDSIGGGDAFHYEEYKKTPKVIKQLLERSIYSLEVKKAIQKEIRETKPDLVYVLHFINKLSPSVIRGAKEMGVLILGKGELEARLKECAEQCGIADHVRFLGFQNNAMEYIKHSDIFVFTIGNNCVIGAGALVTKNVPDNTVWGGVPARQIETIEEYALKVRTETVPTFGMSEAEKKNYLFEHKPELFL